MAKNDVVFVDAVVDERVSQLFPSSDRGEVFEYLALEQLLKRFDLSDDEIKFGWVDGGNDGGIDGFYVLVNGSLVTDLSNFVWPRSDASIEVYVITCKHHDTFLQAPLDNLCASISELFDLTLADAQLKLPYSAEVLEQRAILREAYKKLAVTKPRLAFRFFYVSRGDTSSIGAQVTARSDQVVESCRKQFSGCDVQFAFIGARELVGSIREIRSFSISLPFEECLEAGEGSFLALVTLEKYCRFVSEPDGAIRRYLFDSNVRDFLGDSVVNADIKDSLKNPTSADFWWLNNGVTVLASSAVKAPGRILQIVDVQIVNGLQTTESIFEFFEKGGSDQKNRQLLVKVLALNDAAVRDQIIRATNNQNAVEHAALRATDKIQRDIEEILEKAGWFYERRKNYFKLRDKPPSRLVTPLYLASGFVAFVMKNPALASNLRSRFMRQESSYSKVFAESLPIDIWPKIVEITKAVEAWLDRARPAGAGKLARFIPRWRPVLAYIAVARRLGTYDFSPNDLLGLSSADLPDAFLLQTWQGMIGDSGFNSKEKARRGAVMLACENASKKFGISGLERIGRQNFGVQKSLAQPAVTVSDELVKKVHENLPAQPWKRGVHRMVAERIGCTDREASSAIRSLIDAGRWYEQIDGVVYAKDGAVLMVDDER